MVGKPARVSLRTSTTADPEASPISVQPVICAENGIRTFMYVPGVMTCPAPSTTTTIAAVRVGAGPVSPLGPVPPCGPVGPAGPTNPIAPACPGAPGAPLTGRVP